MSAAIEPREPFGAIVRGFDASRCDSEDAGAIARALFAHRVLTLADQSLDDADFVAFLKKLGPMTFTTGEQPVEGAPDLNLVTNQNRTRPPRSVFHTDTSYVPEPPAITALMIREVPSSGGETLFTDQVRALATLDGALREQIEGRTILHRYARPDGTVESHEHDAIRAHPATGERALYLSTPERCVAVSGMEEAQGRDIIAALYAHSQRKEAILRHRWQPGEVVLWDNRLTMHRADHSAVKGARVLHRGLVQRVEA